MKLFYIIIFASIIFCGFGCQNENGKKKLLNSEVSECDTLLVGKEYLEISLPIYDIDTAFNKFLDSIINAEKQCPFYNSCKSGFVFTVTCDSGKYSIQVSSVNIYCFNYPESEGLFEYKKHRFIIDSYCNINALHKSDKMFLVKYLKLDYLNKPLNNDDRYSTWYFDYVNNEILCKGQQPCYK